MKIFLGDLVHSWNKKGIWTFPLNVGYVASYSKKKLELQGIKSQFKIFKEPEKIISAINNQILDLLVYILQLLLFFYIFF